MTPRPITRGDLHARLPLAGHEALAAYAEREGISLNTALWLLVRGGLEQEGIRVEVGGRPSAPTRSVDGEAEAVASAAVKRAVAGVEARGRTPAPPEPTSSPPPPRAGPSPPPLSGLQLAGVTFLSTGPTRTPQGGPPEARRPLRAVDGEPATSWPSERMYGRICAVLRAGCAGQGPSREGNQGEP